jgi:hypothetical protein
MSRRLQGDPMEQCMSRQAARVQISFKVGQFFL